MSASRRAAAAGLFAGAFLVMALMAFVAGSILRAYGDFSSGALRALSFGWVSVVIALPLVLAGVWAANRARWSLIAGAAVLACGIAAIAIAGEIGVGVKRANALDLPPQAFSLNPVCSQVLAGFTPPVPYAGGTGEDITFGAAHCRIGLDPTGTGVPAVLASYRRQMQDKGWQVDESASTLTGTRGGVTLVVDGSGSTLVWLRITAPAAANPQALDRPTAGMPG